MGLRARRRSPPAARPTGGGWGGGGSIWLSSLRVSWARELELELILSQMAQKPMLRGEVGARALRVRSDVHDYMLHSRFVKSSAVYAWLNIHYFGKALSKVF